MIIHLLEEIKLKKHTSRQAYNSLNHVYHHVSCPYIIPTPSRIGNRIQQRQWDVTSMTKLHMTNKLHLAS